MISFGRRGRNIFFEGNSLMALAAGTDITTPNLNGQYVPRGVYSNFLSSKLSYTSYSVNSRTGTMILSEAATGIMTQLNNGDIIFYWEGTNDMKINGLSGADAFSKLISYNNIVKTKSITLIVGTVIARDAATDPASLMDTEIPAYNALVRNNASTYNYVVCDLAANPIHATRAAASNTDYYQADKLHQVPDGSDIIITGISNTLSTIL